MNRTEVDPIATILTGVEILAVEDRNGWPVTALSDRLVAMFEARERFDAEGTRLAGRWDRQRAWAVDGALSGPDG